MNKTIYVFVCCAIVLLAACKSVNKTGLATNLQPEIDALSTPGYQKIRNLTLTGDFDGNGTFDTLVQINFSRLWQANLDSFPDPYKMPWDSVVAWFYDMESEVLVFAKNLQVDTLNLGLAIGLYCLINVGDVNDDGADDIAIVVDVCDYSRINFCRIYSLCGNAWQEVKSFAIHEDAFNIYGNIMPVFGEISGYLEKKDSNWYYHDYQRIAYDRPEDVGKMELLKTQPCR